MFIFPKIDQWGRPKSKLPDCPNCQEDELGVIHRKLIICYRCGLRIERTEENGKLPASGERISKVDRNKS